MHKMEKEGDGHKTRDAFLRPLRRLFKHEHQENAERERPGSSRALFV